MSCRPSLSKFKLPFAGFLAAIILHACVSIAAQTSTPSELPAEDPVAPPVIRSLDLSAIDKTADPCNDFYQYACGNWIKDNPLPPDQVRWVRSFSQLEERNLYQLWQELEHAAKSPNGPLQKQYGDYFAACMNVDEIERKKLQPLEPALRRIAALSDSKGIAALIHDLASDGEPAPPFQIDVARDQKDSAINILNILPGGLSLPSRNLYVARHSGFIRKRFMDHVTRVFMLAGDTIDRARAEAQAVVEMETELAKASITYSNASDPASRYHVYTMADLQKLAPDFDFTVYFGRMNAPPIKRLNVADPRFVEAVNSLLGSAPIDVWKAYFRWHVLSEQSEALPKAYRDEDFAFWGAYFVRQEKPAPRWMRCTQATDEALSDAISQDWVKHTFPPAAKAGTEQLVVALEHALADEIRSLPWMGAETKKSAEAKLAAIQIRIGSSDHWRDYSKLNIDRSDFLGNLNRHAVFQRSESLSELEKPVDEDSWDLSPSTVEARYVPSMNGLYIPAGILQSPFYDLDSDPAVNFGGIGVVVAHELTHGFDDLGSHFDNKGNVREWLTPDDRKNFAEKTSCEVAEYSQAGAMPDPEELPLIKVNGKLTQAENTADNGGLRIAFLALTKALAAQGKTADSTINGFTEAQRYFLSFAQTWCQNQNFKSARQAAAADPHSPGRWRVDGAVENFGEFGKAFGCTRGTPMYSANSCRVW